MSTLEDKKAGEAGGGGCVAVLHIVVGGGFWEGGRVGSTRSLSPYSANNWAGKPV